MILLLHVHRMISCMISTIKNSVIQLRKIHTCTHPIVPIYYVPGSNDCGVLMGLCVRVGMFDNSGGESPFARVALHMIQQHSMYPLYPAATGTAIDYTHMEKLRLPVTPDIIITPSRLLPTAKVTTTRVHAMRRIFMVILMSLMHVMRHA